MKHEISQKIVYKTMQWDKLAEKPSSSTSMNKGGIHGVNSFITVKAKIGSLMRRIKALETPSAPQMSQMNHLQTPTYFNCRTSNHVMEECLLLVNPMGLIFKQANTLYLRPMNIYALLYIIHVRGITRIFLGVRVIPGSTNYNMQPLATGQFTKTNMGVYQHLNATN